MPYSQFTTITKVKEAFGITTVEGSKFFPEIEPVTPSNTLLDYLAESVPIAVAASTEKFRSEAIVTPILIELRRILNRRISLFSGEEFNVDEAVGLNGVCDFLISGTTEQMAVEAPVIVVLEAKKGDLRLGVGQCVAEMIAAQRFNQASSKAVGAIYGCITTGTVWRFMRLTGQTVEIDLEDYQLTPVSQILGFFVWMIKDAVVYALLLLVTDQVSLVLLQ
ncbi:MAG: hypothetical protein DSM106950_36235 [Stigonema ocellatum SAG 48.90 = DSM 106950]|nr:hypothetical protein [Stigonema ocellatum SAG 48.90 = DSM 106950]